MQSGRESGDATDLNAPGYGTAGIYTQGLSCCCVQSSREEEAARVMFVVCDECELCYKERKGNTGQQTGAVLAHE